MNDHLREITRRHFFKNCGVGVGALALHELLARDAVAAFKPQIDATHPMRARTPRPPLNRYGCGRGH